MDFKLLGKSGFTPPTTPSEAVIETFPNEYKNRNFLIQFDCLDFTSLCPITGQPDYAKIKIKYVPDQLCIETKSLKYFLQSFRNERAFNEKVINTMLLHFVEACQPRWMQIEGQFAARGGIVLTTVVEYPDLDLEKLVLSPY